jgi:hypothetical protein
MMKQSGATRWPASGRRTVVIGAMPGIVVLVGLTACGSRSDALPGSVPVSGVVLYDGKPLGQGTVRFAPESGGQPATGAIVDGRFQMRTTASSPGVVKGRYRISIVSEKVGAVADLPDGVPPDPNNLPRPESLIPARYSDAGTSGLEVDVSGPISDLSLSVETR